MLTDSLAYLTPDLPGVGGALKQRPEDFLVEEQPLYEPSGEGEHLYLFIEKRELTTAEAIRRVATAFRTQRRNIGNAGLKDKHAVTRQHLSVWLPGVPDRVVAESIQRVNENTKLNILWAERHGNKLRRGHHGGNRFVLRLREVEPTHVVRAKQIMDILEQRGVPNYVGEQRFGYRQNSHVLGRLLLQNDYDAFLAEMLGSDYATESPYIVEGRAHYRQGDYQQALDVWPKTLRYDRQALDALRQGKDARQAVRSIDASQRGFLVTAWQSAVFNDVLDQRVKAGTFDTLLPGDLAWKHDNRSVFAVDEATAELENSADGRVPRGEVSPSGPYWGRGMTPASGEPLALERAALERSGLTEGELANADLRGVEGTRRPMRIMPRSAEVSAGVDEHGPYIKTSFDLPRGAYATMVMRELMKN
ncbi:MAG: tRNA pseudouridine(13) synthase TruD, partial [Phycisphaerales bacterium JB063]